MRQKEIIGRTWSVCPVCRKRIPAKRVLREGEVRLEKTCGEHGPFSSVIWRGHMDYGTWRGKPEELPEEGYRRCAGCTGLCRDHLRSTCCVLLEVTRRCNMECSFCFAGARAPGEDGDDYSTEQVKAWVFDLTVPGKTFLQLSGGEPTVRDDLPELIAFARRCGCRYVQLNTNGLRLAEDPEYALQLKDAGLSFVFLQFDGPDDGIYRALRGRDLLQAKIQAIENCAAAGIGVTLVPVIVPGVNDHRIGDIIRFAVRNSPAVRGVHFQPVSYFGRIPREPADTDRFTLDELADAICKQSEGLIRPGQLVPSRCDHPMCGLHGDFIVMPDRTLYPLSGRTGSEENRGEGCRTDPADRNREFIGRRWERTASSGAVSPEEGSADMTDMEVFLSRAKTYGFTVTSMQFQDIWNLDLERLRSCSLHVYRRGKLIPFCANYIFC